MIGAERCFARRAELPRPRRCGKSCRRGSPMERVARQGRGARTRGKGTASGADFVPGRRKPRSGHLRAVRAGWTRVGEFLAERGASGASRPRGSVRELRVWGGRIRWVEGPRRGIRAGADCVTFRRGVGQRAVRRLRLAVDVVFRPGARPLAQLGGPARRRRENDARFPASTSRDAGFTTRSALSKAFCLPQVRPHRARLSRPETRGSAALRKVQNAPAKGQPRESSFPRTASAELSALCLPTGVGATCSGKTCLVCAGRRPAECSAVFCSEQRSAFSASPAAPSGRSRERRLSNRNLKKG